MTEKAHAVRVSVGPLPAWLDHARFLGTEALTKETRPDGALRVSCALPHAEAAVLVARLRGLGIDGAQLVVETTPRLSRNLVRAGRLQDARDRRDASPGFTHPAARATGEGRYSLTPEALALAMGELAAGKRVVEACAGSGGNSIGFARAGCEVLAFDIDPERLEEARQNARHYGVAQRIRFELADACQRVPSLEGDVLFIDPPWGGEDYDKLSTERASFPLLDALLRQDLAGFGEIWIKVPSSFRVASVEGAEASAWFGVAPGDRHRIKFVLLRVPRR